MSTTRAWLAGYDEADAVAGLLVGFRNHMGGDWPSDNAFLASVERLLEDRDTEFLLASSGDGSGAAGVLQLRFRFSVWKASPDAWLEDLFVARGRTPHGRRRRPDHARDRARGAARRAADRA